MNGFERTSKFILASFLLLLLPLGPARAQTDPALKTVVLELLKTYLRDGGPAKEDLVDGASLAHWAVLKGVGFPNLQNQDGLRKGNWNELLAPLRRVLSERGFDSLTPLQAVALWEETEADPQRFVRLLGRDGLLDPKVSRERHRGNELREAVGRARSEVGTVRSNARFEDAGWQFTATAFLSPGSRIVRLAVSGSKLCRTTGRERTLQLNLKGRIFEDPGSPSGLKVQVLDQEFSGRGCELSLKDRIDSVQRLAGGGEAKIAANLDMLIRDEEVTGRFQIDLVSKQAGVALLTGRAVYKMRGSVSGSGELEVELIPVSASGSRVLRQALEKEGKVRGKVTDSVGQGTIAIPVLKDPLNWSDDRKGS